MNLPVALDPAGRVLLRPGRAYRLLVVVNGRTTLEDLAETLFGLGFQVDAFAASGPGTWADDRPVDWPAEPAFAHAANECLVRVSGRFAAPSQWIEPDMPILGSAALYTVIALWECRTPRGAAAGAAASSPARTSKTPAAAAPPTDGEERGRAVAMLVTAGALVGLGLWQHARSEQRFRAETKRMRALLEDQDRSRLDDRIEALMGEGMDRKAAEELAYGEQTTPELAALETIQAVQPGEAV